MRPVPPFHRSTRSNWKATRASYSESLGQLLEGKATDDASDDSLLERASSTDSRGHRKLASIIDPSSGVSDGGAAAASSILGRHSRSRSIKELEMSLTQIEKKGFKHFMLKEVMEQPRVLEDCMRGRVNAEAGTLRLGGIESVMDKLKAATRFVICACGTSWHSALVGEYVHGASAGGRVRGASARDEAG